jgi:hypothetical protein
MTPTLTSKTLTIYSMAAILPGSFHISFSHEISLTTLTSSWKSLKHHKFLGSTMSICLVLFIMLRLVYLNKFWYNREWRRNGGSLCRRFISSIHAAATKLGFGIDRLLMKAPTIFTDMTVVFWAMTYVCMNIDRYVCIRYVRGFAHIHK